MYDESFCFSRVLDEPFDKNVQVACALLSNPDLAARMQDPACMRGLVQIMLLPQLTPFILYGMLQYGGFYTQLGDAAFVHHASMWIVALTAFERDDEFGDLQSDDSIVIELDDGDSQSVDSMTDDGDSQSVDNTTDDSIHSTDSLYAVDDEENAMEEL